MGKMSGLGRMWYIQEGRLELKALPSARSNSNGLLYVGTPNGTRSWSPSQDYSRSCGKIQATVIMVDTNMLRYVCIKIPYGTTPTALQWTKTTLNTHRTREAPTVWPSDTSHHLTATRLRNWTSQDIRWIQLLCTF